MQRAGETHETPARAASWPALAGSGTGSLVHTGPARATPGPRQIARASPAARTALARFMIRSNHAGGEPPLLLLSQRPEEVRREVTGPAEQPHRGTGARVQAGHPVEQDVAGRVGGLHLPP